MTESKVFTTLRIDEHPPGIRMVTIVRPQALNALNSVVLTELRQALRAAADDRSVRVLVLTGEGAKSFVAGADILEMKDKSPQEAMVFAQLGHEVGKLLELMAKPTIAAVNGFALGGGCELAMACDFIVAAENAVFAQPEVGLGIIPGFGGTLRLARLVGVARAKDLIFTGRRVQAVEAREIGLAARVFPQEGFLGQVLELAAQISRNSAPAVAKCKQLMNEFSETVGLNSKIDAEAHAFGRLFGSRDQIEGMGAFAEKRKPTFVG
jgi:enoyl-CoA hydratase